MTTKTYRTRELKGFALHLRIDGKMTHIEFKRGCTIGSTSTYTTSNEKIQEALEALKSFGPTFYIEKESVINEVPVVEEPKVTPEPTIEEEKEVVDILDAKTFKNLVELRNALVANGIDVPSNITNVKAAEAFSKKNGYNYTIEKKA